MITQGNLSSDVDIPSFPVERLCTEERTSSVEGRGVEFGTLWVGGPLNRATAFYEFSTRRILSWISERTVSELSLPLFFTHKILSRYTCQTNQPSVRENKYNIWTPLDNIITIAKFLILYLDLSRNLDSLTVARE